MRPINIAQVNRPGLTRGEFMRAAWLASSGLVGAEVGLRAAEVGLLDAPGAQASAPESRGMKDLPLGGKPIKLFCCDFNWVHLDSPVSGNQPAAPQDWGFVNPKEYFDWHVNFGVNVMFCQAYAFGGYAFYPTKLGPVAPGPGRDLCPSLFKLARKAHMPFHAYFCAGTDLIMSKMRNSWIVPTSRPAGEHRGYFLAPESPWTDLLCSRVTEFLRLCPADWIVFDWFVYGSLRPNNFAVQPAWFVKAPFKEIIGRDMPGDAAQITPAESLEYKRAVMAKQFYRIKEAVHKGSPATKIYFNVPYWEPGEALWMDHAMLNESDMLLAESSDAVVPWLLGIRKPHQRVMTTIVGRQDGVSDPSTWKRWYEAGCDFFGYAWGTPPDFRPHPKYAAGVDVIRKAYHQMP